MRFSYKLLKQLIPNLPPPAKTAELLAAHIFEVESVTKDTLDIAVLPNRYSDAASHWGLARELSALLGRQFPEPKIKTPPIANRRAFKVKIETVHCRRLIARPFSEIKITPSPRWLREILIACGQQPINNLVDITNYVTLETGQPLHAFDLEKLHGDTLFIRPAKKGEVVTSLEDKQYLLDAHDLVLSDQLNALDIAGVKGGKKAAISDQTSQILLTAGNFHGSAIYQTSRKIKLRTDASLRFSHDLSPELIAVAINRASELIKELCGGKAGKITDAYPAKPDRVVLKFDINHFNSLAGLNLKEKEALSYLQKIGFKVKGKLVAVPPIRTDIERFEDLAEEILRLYGYANLPPALPLAPLTPPGENELVVFKSEIRKILTGFGLDEVYNYSFVSADDLAKWQMTEAVALENPISLAYECLRPSLLPALEKNLIANRRFFNRVGIFEIGKVFQNNNKETLHLAIALADPAEKTFFEAKGAAEQLLQALGLTDYHFPPSPAVPELRIESDHSVLGRILTTAHKKEEFAFMELDLDKLINLVDAERSFEPFAKYPAITRDISLLLPPEVRFADLLSLIEKSAPQYIEDVDLIDFYDQRSLTFRLVFRADSRTLTDKEVDQELAKITHALVDNFDVEIR